MNNLFDYMNNEEKIKKAPLAFRMRPINLDNYVGQEHILGENKPLRRLIEEDKIFSIILYGSSGTGKTSLSQIIANMTKSEFVKINATIAGKSQMVEVVEKARTIKSLYNKNTILFIDEIHRFNKAQQDYLLPFVEDATLRLIGATTENPYFEVNSALISRSIIFKFNPLSHNDLEKLLNKAILFLKENDNINLKLQKEAALNLIKRVGGDARRLLQHLETLVLMKNNEIITEEDVTELLDNATVGYTKDDHYDTISAFIKSMRGTDPDAAVFYLAKMLASGEDISFIMRRLMIFASEDIGNADPMALVMVTNTAVAIERVGLPEARIILAQLVIYLASAHKSNSCYLAINKAMSIVKDSDYKIPRHLRDAHYGGAKKLGHGISYKYPHDYENSYVSQRYLPEGIDDTIYTPKDIGYEKLIKENLEKLRGNKYET